MSQKIQAIRGMEDVLPDQSALWERLEDACREAARILGGATFPMIAGLGADVAGAAAKIRCWYWSLRAPVSTISVAVR